MYYVVCVCNICFVHVIEKKEKNVYAFVCLYNVIYVLCVFAIYVLCVFAIYVLCVYVIERKKVMYVIRKKMEKNNVRVEE